MHRSSCAHIYLRVRLPSPMQIQSNPYFPSRVLLNRSSAIHLNFTERTCSTFGGGENCVRNFGKENRREETIHISVD